MTTQTGLSPRVRGKPNSTRPPGSVRRSIPACAGEAPAPTSGHTGSWVYPRVCGGSPDFWEQPETIVGLSPRVRGKPKKGKAAETDLGSIPACAGEAPPTPELVEYAKVYPRVCGGSA